MDLLASVIFPDLRDTISAYFCISKYTNDNLFVLENALLNL